MNTPFVSIIIPAFNASKTIARTIEACLNQTYPQEKLEVIVVDDGSTDRTREIVTHYPVVLVSQRNSGPAAARNRGWRASKGEMICFTDADCIPEKEWISKLVKKYTSQEIGGVGGSYGIVNCESFLASSIHEEIVERHLKMPSSVDYLGSFNLSYRREVLEEMGGFNETYREASGEDNDLSYRVKKAGYTLLFDPTIVVAHHHPERLFRYLRQQFKHGYWRVLLYLQHPTMARGDSYSKVCDLAQPPLLLLTLSLLPLVFLSYTRALLLFFLTLGFVLQFPLPLAMARRTGRKLYLLFSLVTYLRGYARALGMGLGIFFALLQVIIPFLTESRPYYISSPLAGEDEGGGYPSYFTPPSQPSPTRGEGDEWTVLREKSYKREFSKNLFSKEK